MKQNEHGRLIAAAGKRHLSLLGLKRKGQSRIWRSDHGFWIINVEFQPSGWSGGSYLNVGAQWLWREWGSGGISFDYGYRVANFVPFETSEQFEPEAERLAIQAAEEVQRLRRVCQPLSSTAEFLSGQVHMWPQHRWTSDAAIALGLVGDIERSHLMFQAIPDFLNTDEEADKLRGIIADLQCSLSTPERFEASVADVVNRQRGRNKLAQLSDPLQDLAII